MDKTWSHLWNACIIKEEDKTVHIIQAGDPKDGWSVANTGMLNTELVGLLHSSIPRY